MLISQELMKSYREATYYVEDTLLGLVYALRVGQPNKEVDALLQRNEVGTGFIFTAWNPHSVDQPLEQNQAMNKALLKDPLVDRKHVGVYPSFGGDEEQTWREEGFFFTNLDCLEAQELCRRYKQNAGVMISVGMGPELVWHPDVVLP